MRNSIILFIVLPIVICSCQKRKPIDSDFVLRGGYIIDGTGKDLTENKDIVIYQGKIKSIIPQNSMRYSQGTKILTLDDKYIIPGFIEMHAHIPGDSSIQREVLKKYLSLGITTILNPMADSLSGIGLKKKLESEGAFLPKYYTAGNGINGPSWVNIFSFISPVANEEEARNEVRKQVSQGVDFIKVYAHLPTKLLQVVINEAHHHELKVIGHLGETSWKDAAESGIDIIAHSALAGPTWELVPEEQKATFRSNYFTPKNGLSIYKPSLFEGWLNLVDYKGEKARELISTLVKNKVVVDPNLVVFESIIFANKPETKERLDIKNAPEKLREQWSSDQHPATVSWSEEDYQTIQQAWTKFLAFIKILHSQGITLTAGSDLGNPWITPGVAFHRELELLVEAGISSSDVIQIATRNGAEVLGAIDDIGTIEEGKIANITILDQNPLNDITNTKKVFAVVLEGEYLSKEKLNDLKLKLPH